MPATPTQPLAHRLRHLWADRLDPTAYLGLHLAVSLAGIALCTWAFGAVLDAILDNGVVVRWDMASDLAIHRHMTPPDLRVVDWVTQLGAPVTVAALGVVVAVVLWRGGHRSACWGWIAAIAGGGAVGQLFKVLVHRTRPAYGAAHLHGHSYSFPSGHAMGSMILYGMLAWLARHAWHARPHRRRLVVALATLLVIAIGTSRILLGVHYPSDVVGGWAIGLAWLWTCTTAVEIAEARRIDREHSAAAAALDDAALHPARR